jgi:hypothetical protein
MYLSSKGEHALGDFSRFFDCKLAQERHPRPYRPLFKELELCYHREYVIMLPRGLPPGPAPRPPVWRLEGVQLGLLEDPWVSMTPHKPQRHRMQCSYRISKLCTRRCYARHPSLVDHPCHLLSSMLIDGSLRCRLRVLLESKDHQYQPPPVFGASNGPIL